MKRVSEKCFPALYFYSYLKCMQFRWIEHLRVMDSYFCVMLN